MKKNVMNQSVFNNRIYFRWFIADTCAEIGSQFSFLAFTLLAYSITHDVALSGFVSAIQAFTRFLVMLPGGAIIDRFPKKTLLYLFGFSKVALAFSITILIFNNLLNFPLLTVYAVCFGLVGGLFGNLTNTLLPLLLKGDVFEKAVVANQTRDSIIHILAAPIGGFFYAFNIIIPFIVEGSLYIIFLSTCPILSRSLPHFEKKDNTFSPQSLLRDIIEGLAWLKNNKDLLILLAVFMLSSLSSFIHLTSIDLQLQKTNTSATLIGIVHAAFSLGMIVGGILSSKIKILNKKKLILASYIAIFFQIVFIIPSSNWLWISITLLIGNIPFIAANSILYTYQMQKTPKELLGRIGTVFSCMIGLTPIFANTFSGLLLKYAGWAPTLSIAALFALFVILLLLKAKPMFEKLTDEQ